MDLIFEIPKEVLELNDGKPLVTVDYINDWKDYLNRRLFINSDIDDITLDVITYHINSYNKEDVGLPIENRVPIKLFVNSDGGGLYEGMHISDIIRMSKTPVWTICQSRAYSSGGLIFISGHKRFCYPSSSFLLHNGSMGIGGKTDSVFDNIEFSKGYEKHIKKLFLEKTNITSKMYDDNYRREWYMDSNDMLNYGVTDEISKDLIF